MGIQQLTLATLKKLSDGRLWQAFEFELARAVKDCRNRPLEKKAREINLTIKLIPKPDAGPDGVTCNDVKTKVSVKPAKLPNHETSEITMGLRMNDTLVFNPDSPENPNQLTIPMGDDEDESEDDD